MIEINLIPDVKQELLTAQRQRSVVISAAIAASIVAVGIVVLLLVYIFAVQGVRSALLDDQIKSRDAELSKVEDLSKILTIQNQLSTISQLNDKKLMSSRLFDVIAAISPVNESSVSFSQVNIIPAGTEEESSSETTGGGKIQLEGQTVAYESMENFKKRIDSTSFHFKKDNEEQTVKLAQNISTTDMSYGEDSTGQKVLRFTLSFEYPPELFSSATTGQEITYKLTVNGNVTDSYLGIPRFTQRANDLPAEGGQ